MTPSRAAPYPPRHLAERVFGFAGWGERDRYRAYEELGAQTQRALIQLLPDEWSFDGKRVLDFGAGAGRTLRHFLPQAERGEFWGMDIDAASVEWLDEHLCPPLHAWKCEPVPPSGLEHGSFDLIWAISVFTHLTDNWSAWLLELHRLLKPEGLLIATYMGRWNSEFFAGEPWTEDRVGMNVLRHHQDWDSGGPAVLISDWWMREHWGRAFEVLEVAPQVHNMSWALLRRRAVELTTDDLERPADDPREYLALRHNLRQMQRDERELARFEASRLAAMRAERDAARREVERLGELCRHYELSLSWRLTRPLRNAALVLRRARSRRG